VPATAVPVPAVLGPVTRNDDLVALAGPDLVVATGAAVGLLRFIRLHVADVDVVVGFRPAVRAHATVTVSPRATVLVPIGDQGEGTGSTWTA
jgi:hypothetical protein